MFDSYCELDVFINSNQFLRFKNWLFWSVNFKR